MDFQQTIKTRVALDGIGLHSGRAARITLSPARANSGIVFRVAGHQAAIPALASSVVDSHYATTLGVNGTRIQTVEHLMAAAAGLGLDDLEVGVDGTEIPAVDGSARPFVALLYSAGRTTLAARRQPRRPERAPLPRRVRPPQGPRPDRRPRAPGPAGPRSCHRAQRRPRPQLRAGHRDRTCPRRRAVCRMLRAGTGPAPGRSAARP